MSGERFTYLLRQRLEDATRLTADQVEALRMHWSLYQRWNRALNLSAIRDLETAVERHYCESLFLGARLPKCPLRVVDVGSGAGFPGYPIAVLRPDCDVMLVESHRRKAAFLKEATRGRSNVRVFAGRAEELQEHFDWLVCRAVAWARLEREALRLADHLALLGGATGIPDWSRLRWREPVPLPWAGHGFVWVADVSRGTS